MGVNLFIYWYYEALAKDSDGIMLFFLVFCMVRRHHVGSLPFTGSIIILCLLFKAISIGTYINVYLSSNHHQFLWATGIYSSLPLWIFFISLLFLNCTGFF